MLLMVGFSRNDVAHICGESTDTVEAIFSSAKRKIADALERSQRGNNRS
jgi:DNA-directed RNA polymerase specialized sigma24 family protein